MNTLSTSRCTLPVFTSARPPCSWGIDSCVLAPFVLPRTSQTFSSVLYLCGEESRKP